MSLNAPLIPPFSNDAGLLTAGCYQGSACLGDITATGNVAIGLASNNGLISLRTRAIDFTGVNFDVATFDRIDLGGLPAVLNASGRISLTSDIGDISLTNLTLQAADLRISAGGSLDGATSSLISPNSILLQVGSSASLNIISTGGSLDDGSDTGVFHVPGTFDVGTLVYAGADSIAIEAGGDLSVGYASANGNDITLYSDQAIFLGITAPDTRNITLDGVSIGFNNLHTSGLVRLTARSGGIVGISETSPVIDARGNIVLDAAADILVGSLVADGSISASGNAITAAGLSADGDIDLTARNAGTVASFFSGGDATFTGRFAGADERDRGRRAFGFGQFLARLFGAHCRRKHRSQRRYDAFGRERDLGRNPFAVGHDAGDRHRVWRQRRLGGHW